MNPSLITLLIAGLAELSVATLWYRPNVFGGAWKRMSGMSPEAAERSARQRHFRVVASFLSGVLIAYVLGSIGSLTAVAGPVNMFLLAFLAWAGFVAPALFTATLIEGKRFPFFFINAGHWLVSFIVIMLILITF